MIEQNFGGNNSATPGLGNQGIVILELESGTQRHLGPLVVAATILARLSAVMVHFATSHLRISGFPEQSLEQKFLDDLNA